jgi:hypothetical protein
VKKDCMYVELMNYFKFEVFCTELGYYCFPSFFPSSPPTVAYTLTAKSVDESDNSGQRRGRINSFAYSNICSRRCAFLPRMTIQVMSRYADLVSTLPSGMPHEFLFSCNICN